MKTEDRQELLNRLVFHSHLEPLIVVCANLKSDGVSFIKTPFWQTVSSEQKSEIKKYIDEWWLKESKSE